MGPLFLVTILLCSLGLLQIPALITHCTSSKDVNDIAIGSCVTLKCESQVMTSLLQSYHRYAVMVLCSLWWDIIYYYIMKNKCYRTLFLFGMSVNDIFIRRSNKFSHLAWTLFLLSNTGHSLLVAILFGFFNVCCQNIHVLYLWQ